MPTAVRRPLSTGSPHDHNFEFLTIGYHGPGYRSDHYEVDPQTIVGVVGEKVVLTPKGSSTLAPGQVMHLSRPP